MYSVYPGTAVADEVNAVCSMAQMDGPAAKAEVRGQESKPSVETATPEFRDPEATPPAVLTSPKVDRTTPKAAPPAAGPIAATLKLVSTGSGALVSANGHIVTNQHVVDGCKALGALVSGRVNEATLVAEDADVDLSIVRISNPATGFVSLRNSRNEDLGEEVMALGFPLFGTLSQEVKVTTGVISSLAGIGGDRRYMQISAPVQPGNSGGPVLDGSGNLVGIVVGKLAERFKGENVNFAIRLPALRSFLELNGVAYRSQGPGRRVSSAEVARIGQRATVLIGCFK